jgi:hypothetical protein
MAIESRQDGGTKDGAIPEPWISFQFIIDVNNYSILCVWFVDIENGACSHGVEMWLCDWARKST